MSIVPFALLGNLHFLSSFEMEKVVEAEYDEWVRRSFLARVCKYNIKQGCGIMLIRRRIKTRRQKTSGGLLDLLSLA